MGKKRRFLFNTAILTAGSILLRFVGIWFRSVITVRIGASGMGLYQLIFSIFTLGITACTSGIGLAVTRLAAEGRGSKGCMLRCAGLSLGLSLAAGGTLFCGAGLIASRLIGSSAAAEPLRILAAGLPCIAGCACLKGYFFANRNTAVPILGEFCEEGVTVGASIFLLDHTGLPALNALMLGSTLGEAASVLYIVPIFLWFVRKHGMAEESSGLMRSIVHIAGPMLAGSFLRSSLISAENVLIPIGLKMNGAGGIAALAQYGVMQGMVMPILMFPLSLLSSAAMLLIPEIAEANAGNDLHRISRTAEKAFRWTLLFGFPTASFFLAFADELGILLFGSAQAGQILRIMAPLAPLMYLDNVTDNLLKGLDQQMYSLEYNLTDSLMRVILIAVFIPVFGIKAYIAILFASEIYNASLSIGRLLKVTSLRVDFIDWILYPAVLGGLAFYAMTLLKKLFQWRF
ncbi:MAG: polysaccharide biosynthesis C-terminal domain-containing protein [Oscillospiraceae bacterium]|jgi:stage V sporulation protein B|nr:polysaccharide biosynthesis C-terminal domain-containing protein [Oscillospiraceae bacterium]